MDETSAKCVRASSVSRGSTVSVVYMYIEQYLIDMELA